MKILHVVLNDFVNDARVARAARAGAELGHEVTVLALHRNPLAIDEIQDGVRVHRLALKTRAGGKMLLPVKYLEAVQKVGVFSSRYAPDVIHAHDLSALIPSARAAGEVPARLVYDAHEYWPGVHHWEIYGRIVRRLAVSAERLYARRADRIITVSDSIADRMAAEMGVPRPTVIRNIPEAPREMRGAGVLRRTLPNAEAPIVLYQGGIKGGRGLESVVEAWPFVHEAHLVFIGSGPLVPQLEKRASDLGVRDRVHFRAAVPYRELLNWTQDATLGMCPMDGSVINHQLALPNKLFEYLHCHVPVVTADLPEMRAVLQRYGIGVTYSEHADGIAATLNNLLGTPGAVEKLRAACVVAAEQLTWEREAQRLKQIYTSLAKTSQGD